jgi:hypothetical protein
MDIAAERDFGFVRGATREHIPMDLRPRSDKAQNQKTLSPQGFVKMEPFFFSMQEVCWSYQ